MAPFHHTLKLFITSILEESLVLQFLCLTHRAFESTMGSFNNSRIVLKNAILVHSDRSSTVSSAVVNLILSHIALGPFWIYVQLLGSRVYVLEGQK